MPISRDRSLKDLVSAERRYLRPTAQEDFPVKAHNLLYRPAPTRTDPRVAFLDKLGLVEKALVSLFGTGANFGPKGVFPTWLGNFNRKLEGARQPYGRRAPRPQAETDPFEEYRFSDLNLEES